MTGPDDGGGGPRSGGDTGDDSAPDLGDTSSGESTSDGNSPAGGSNGEPAEHGDGQEVVGLSDPDDGGDGDDGDDADDDRSRRRLFWLLVLLALVLVGGGIGTFVFGGQPDEAPGIQTPGPAQNETGNVSLSTVTGTRMLRATDIAPGDGGASRIELRNTGDREGELVFGNLSVRGAENGITGPEAAVDDTAGQGELADNLEVRLSGEYRTGDTVTVFGTDSFVRLSTVDSRNRTIGPLGPEEVVTIVLEWRLPAETGNEVQGDSVVFDVLFGLRPLSNETTGQLTS